MHELLLQAYIWDTPKLNNFIIQQYSCNNSINNLFSVLTSLFSVLFCSSGLKNNP